MRDPADRPEPPTRKRAGAAGRTGRPRFAMPTDHHDERTNERIEAFLEGPVRARRSRPRHLRTQALVRPRRLVPLDTRADWDAAVGHEDARLARYGRAATVLVVEVRAVIRERDERLVGRVGKAIREHARETDRVARVSPTRYHVLLPETTEAEAAALAERIRQTCAGWDPVGPGQPVHLGMAAVTPPRGGTLVDALRLAQARLEE
ncbi:MAG: diguanylate cyclase [Chloroflexota bacterium]